MKPTQPSPDERALERKAARSAIQEALEGLEMVSPAESLEPEATTRIADLRRRRRMLEGFDPLAMVTLVELDDGTFVWREGMPACTVVGRRRRAGRTNVAPIDAIVVPIKTRRLEPNQVGAYLARLDAKLTPHAKLDDVTGGYQGLRRLYLRNGGFELKPIHRPDPTPAPGDQQPPKRILLFVHGTFSNSETFIDELWRVRAQTNFLTWAAGHYDQILTFDHPTLSIGPHLNGLDLARLFREVRGPVDIVCHSRGGLVVRWWLEAFDGWQVGDRRAIFVASPLGGTSLASPPRLRSALDLFTNVGIVLKHAGEAASVYAPYLSLAVGLIKLVTAVTRTLARTSVVDAAFAMIPGLVCQSRVGNNLELARLHSDSRARVDYSFIITDFEPIDEGWRFWRNFVNLKDRAWHRAIAPVFDDPNDLVVDTPSMLQLLKDQGVYEGDSRVFDFRTVPHLRGKVHHTNYFSQIHTWDFIGRRFAP